MFLASIDTLTITAIASAAVAERKAVTFAGATAGADARVLGVSKMAAETGEALPLTILGVVDMVAGAAITAGDKLVSNAAGLPVPQGAGSNPFGEALNTAAIGARVSVLLR